MSESNRPSFLYKLIELYLTPRFWERNGKLYKFLGIKVFKKYVPTSGDYVRRRFGATLIRIKSIEDVREYEKHTRASELAHVTLFLATVPLMVLYLILGVVGPFWSLVVANLLINIYPVMLQRYNRARIYKIIARYDNRDGLRPKQH